MKYLMSIVLVFNAYLPMIAMAKTAETPLSQRLVNLPTKPTLRAYLTVLLARHSKSEIDGVMQFAKEHAVDLDGPVPIHFAGSKLFVFEDELKFNAQSKSFTYAGIEMKPSQQPVDVLVRDLFAKLTTKTAANWSFSLFPEANATVRTNIVKTDIAAVVAMLVSGFFSYSENLGIKAAGAAVATGSGVFLMASAFLLMNTLPGDAAGMVEIESASCNANGLKINTKAGKSLSMTLNKVTGKVDFASGSDHSALPPAAEVSFAEALRNCATTPMPGDQLKSTLQRIIDDENRKLAGNTSGASSGQPAAR